MFRNHLTRFGDSEYELAELNQDLLAANTIMKLTHNKPTSYSIKKPDSTSNLNRRKQTLPTKKKKDEPILEYESPQKIR